MMWDRLKFQNYYWCKDWTDFDSIMICVVRGILMTILFLIVFILVNVVASVVYN